MADRHTPRLTVLAGPTAVGKGTVVRELVRQYPQVWLSVSATTRAPRPGELDGEHYLFVDNEQFDELIARGGLLEFAEVHGQNRYGTPRKPVEQHLADGVPVLLEIDLDGARQVKKAMPEALMVFLAPPSQEELVNRLVGRGTEDAAERARRLETARIEMAAQTEFDEVVVNHEVPQAAAEIAALMGLDAS